MMTTKIYNEFHVATTDATSTILATLPVTLDASVLVNGFLVARRTGGVSGTNGDSAAFIMNTIAKNIGGVVTLLAQNASFSSQDQVSWAATFSVSGSNVVLTVAGATGNNIDWVVYLNSFEVL